jgi:type I restriction enzyme M protein
VQNERKTESIVREALRANGYFDAGDLRVEEQRSDDPRIQKLLKSASKAGNGVGLPEFIISSATNTGFLIVIECKADAARHESASGDKHAEFALDGALLYASHLSKHFDVLAIAVSGQTKRECRISHRLVLRGGVRVDQIFGREILPYGDYYSGYSSHPKKFSQDYERLLAYTRELNEILQAKKVKESQRSLLISGILIALQNSAFEASFRRFTTAKKLATHLVNTVIDELSDAQLPQGKLESLRQGFGFIKTHSTLSNDKAFLESLILGIDENVNSFRKTHHYFDTLGQFYIEFLRYANNDKGLGIVLTPPHITELFCELAGVNKDSVVFDNTCGTGGFLISAMQRMIADAKGDNRKIRRIQNSQLVGIEFQDDIYSLAVTNMVLHGDGKTNIHQGDCFSLAPTVARPLSPNVGLLNPPYRTKKSAIEELEFVLNNLETLERGGTCVAIVPISCVLAQDGPGLELKKRLLERHTLEGALSMPPELFHNSKVGVVTAAVVLTAHIPHPRKKKTWLGYCRDDGFTKRKHLGRIDLHGNWLAIKQSWVTAFRNKEIVRGYSVMRALEPDDEWCAEAFMRTDYSKLTKEDFERELKRYVVFQILQNTSGQENEQTDNEET